MKLRHSQVTVNLDAIRHNYKQLKQAAPNSRCIAVVKADAYGHGAVKVAKALSHKNKVMADAFAVATVPEALELRQADIEQKIIVLGGFINEHELLIALEYKIDCVVHSQFQIDLLLRAGNTDLKLWLKINSGMGRLGFNVNEVTDVLHQLSAFSIVSLMTHLASADDINNNKTTQQLNTIKALELNQYDWSISNSAGTLGWPDGHKQWVRFGIALYGVNPFATANKSALDLKPVMRFESQLVAIYKRNKGDTIGYSSTFVCDKEMLIGVVGAGYADGYPRHIDETANVLIKDTLVRIIGRVSMDMITVDLTQMSDAKINDSVILWHQNPCAEHIANSSGTIAYELCCNAGAHAQVEYSEKA